MNTNYKRYLFKIVAFITILAFTPLQILSSSVFANTRIENKKQSCVIDTGKPEKFVTGFIPSNFTFTDLPFSSKSHLRIEQPDQSLIGSEIKRILGNKGDGYTLQHSGLKLPPKVKEAIMEQLATMEDETPQQRAKAVLESEVMRKATGDTVNWLNNLLMSIYNGERINLEKEGIAGDMAEVIEAVQKKPARSNIKASEPKTNGSNFIMDIPDEELIKQLRVELNIRQRKYIERLIKIFDILWDEDRAKTKKSDFYKKLFHKFIITQTLGTDYGTFYMGKPGPKPSNAPVNILKDKGISIPPELDLLLHGTTLKNVGEVFTKISESKLSAPEQKWLKQGYLYFYIASRIEHNADYLKKKTAGAKVETRPQPFQSFRDSLSLLSKNKIKPELYLPVSKLNAMLVNGMSYGYSQIIAIATEASQPVDLPRSEREARIMEIESDLKEKYSDEKEIAHRLQEIAADLDVTKDEMIKLFNIGFSMSGYDGLLSIFEGRIKFPFNSLEDKITTGALKAVIDKRKKPDYLWYAAIKDTISNLDRFNEIITTAKIDLPQEATSGYTELRTASDLPTTNIYQNLPPDLKKEIMDKLDELDKIYETGVAGRKSRAKAILDIVEAEGNPNYILLVTALKEIEKGNLVHLGQLHIASNSDFQEILDRVLLTPPAPPTINWANELINSNCPQATASNGTVYLADTKNNRIIKYQPDSGELEVLGGYTSYGLEKLEAPQKISFDRTGNLIIIDEVNKITYWPTTRRWDWEPLLAQSSSKEPSELTALSPPPEPSSEQKGKLPDSVKIPLINSLARLPRYYTRVQRAQSVLDSLGRRESERVLILKKGLDYIAKGGVVDLSTVKDEDIRDILEIVQTRVEDLLPQDVRARQAIEDLGINLWYEYTRTSSTYARQKVIFAPKELFLGASSKNIIGLREALQMLSLRKCGMYGDEPEMKVVVLCDNATDSETIKAMELPNVLTIVDTNFDLTKPIPVDDINSLFDANSPTYQRNWLNMPTIIDRVKKKDNVGIIAKPMASDIIDVITEESEIENLTKEGVSVILLEAPTPENNQFISAFTVFCELAKSLGEEGKTLITIITPISLPSQIYDEIQDYMQKLLALQQKA